MNNISIFTIIYAVLAIISLSLIFVYLNEFKNELNRNGLIVLIAIFLVVSGYFLISCSKSLNFALIVNRIAYIGSIVMIVEMYLIINDFCNGIKNNKLTMFLMVVSLLIYLLCATGGTSITLYYESVELVINDGLSKLIKEYGPLHNVYTYYVIIMFIFMISKIVLSIKNKTLKVYINPVILVLLGTENMFVWVVEKFVNMKMELLAASYVITEIMFVLLFKNAAEFKKATDYVNKKGVTVENIIQEWSDKYSLTEREREILELLINNISRADIAETLFISEHTVKKHTANLYDKLCVTSRNDLLYKLNEELTN